MRTGPSFKSVLLLVLLIVSPGMAISGEINTGTSGNTAILGYDPVAFFTKRRAVKGSDSITYNWLGAEWHFSNEKHKKMFAENPLSYAPQYGGFCADGIAYGVTERHIDPNAWRIIGGKLYLNYDEASAIHLQETEGELEKSQANWPALREELLKASE